MINPVALLAVGMARASDAVNDKISILLKRRGWSCSPSQCWTQPGGCRYHRRRAGLPPTPSADEWAEYSGQFLRAFNEGYEATKARGEQEGWW